MKVIEGLKVYNKKQLKNIVLKKFTWLSIFSVVNSEDKISEIFFDIFKDV